MALSADRSDAGTQPGYLPKAVAEMVGRTTLIMPLDVYSRVTLDYSRVTLYVQKEAIVRDMLSCGYVAQGKEKSRCGSGSAVNKR